MPGLTKFCCPVLHLSCRWRRKMVSYREGYLIPWENCIYIFSLNNAEPQVILLAGILWALYVKTLYEFCSDEQLWMISGTPKRGSVYILFPPVRKMSKCIQALLGVQNLPMFQSLGPLDPSGHLHALTNPPSVCLGICPYWVVSIIVWSQTQTMAKFSLYTPLKRAVQKSQACFSQTGTGEFSHGLCPSGVCV